MHPKDRSALDVTCEELAELFGSDLLAVALTGEAAGSGYRPRRSPLSLAVVLERVTADALRRARPHVRRWRRRRVGVPLFLDRAYIHASLDVFPLEFLDLKERHDLVHGQTDPFQDVAIDREHLRLEVEEQIKGKLLHLREAYMESAGRKSALRHLLVSTPTEFGVILRGMLALAEASRPDDDPGLIGAAEETLGIPLPALRRLARVAAGAERIQRGELEPTFDRYLAEVEALADHADRAS